MPQRRLYYGLYLALILILFGAIGAVGLIDRHALSQLVEERGPLELGTAFLWGGLSAVALALALAEGARHLGGRRAWLALAALAVVFAGEEIEWGHELPGAHSPPGSSAHNWAARVFVDSLTERSEVMWVLGVALFVGVLFVFHRFGSRWIRWGQIVHSKTPLLAFFSIAIAWLAIATACDLLETLGVPYLMGQWILEETGEFLAAVSACTGVLAHCLCAERLCG